MPFVASAQSIVAHRGASYDAPENTLAAFRLAWQQASDGIEGDFYLTRDNEIVCIHDATTERTTEADLNVQSSDLGALRTLDAGKWKAARFAGEPIPTFEEVFETVPENGLFVIELKSKSEIVPVLVEQIRRIQSRRDRSCRLLVISFDAATVKAFKELMPDVTAHWLTGFDRDRNDGTWTPEAASVAATVRQCRADGVGMKAVRDVVDRAFVETLRRGGCAAFHVWTIDEPADARYFQSLGAEAITTNRPALIRRAVEPAAAAGP